MRKMKYRDYFACVPTLETPRCILRAFGRADMEAYFDIVRDQKVQQY